MTFNDISTFLGNHNFSNALTSLAAVMSAWYAGKSAREAEKTANNNKRLGLLEQRMKMWSVLCDLENEFSDLMYVKQKSIISAKNAFQATVYLFSSEVHMSLMELCANLTRHNALYENSQRFSVMIEIDEGSKKIKCDRDALGGVIKNNIIEIKSLFNQQMAVID